MPQWTPEAVVDEALARRLIEGQFPELDAGGLRLLGTGWDSTVWLVDERWAFRFPRREVVVPSIARQAAILPALAPLLPLAIPVPAFHGRPAEGYPWPFQGAELLPGRELHEAGLTDAERARAAPVLAAFLRALHSAAARELPGVADLPLDPVRRADMPLRVARTAEALQEVERLGLWRAPPAVAGWLAEAERLPAPAAPALAHGDLHLRHLLVHGREPSAVIDWVDICRADPAIDLVLYWGRVPAGARPAFLDAYGPIGEDQLLRARVLSLNLCGVLAAYARAEGMASLAREAVAGLERTVRD